MAKGVAVALPDMMTAIEISAPGGPEVLVPCQRPVPVPGEGEVLVKVRYISLDAAKKHGLKMWLFDERWWPSGEVAGNT